MELTSTFTSLLDGFQSVFTAPSFVTFQLLMTGWILSVRHRYVTDLIVTSDSVGNGHFSDYHRFFSHATWNIDQLWKCLAILIVKTLIGKDASIILAGDDTLCRKRGLGIFGTGMHHDALSSSKGPRKNNLINFCEGFKDKYTETPKEGSRSAVLPYSCDAWLIRTNQASPKSMSAKLSAVTN